MSQLEPSWNNRDKLRQYDGTIYGKRANLTYARWERDGLKCGALIACSNDHDNELLEVNNDRVICAIERPQTPGAYDIKTVLVDTADTPEPPRRQLEVWMATNLPPDFVEDNSVSPSFPFLQNPSAVAPSEEGSPSRLYVIVSTHSGPRQAENFYNELLRPLLASGDIQVQKHEEIITSSEKSIIEFASNTLIKEANNGVRQTVLLLSGDGGVVDIVNTLLSHKRTSAYQKPALGLVAMGTGNALAYSIGLSRDRTLGLRRFYRGTPHPLPTFTVTFSPGAVFLVNEGRDTEIIPANDKGEGVVYGAVVCSWALHASIVADSDTTEYRKHGNRRFVMAANELLHPSDESLPHEYKGSVSYCQSGKIDNPLPKQGPCHAYVLATTVSHLEPGFNISPYSTPLDGKLRVLRLGPTASSDMEGILGKAFKDGSHVDDPAVTYGEVQSMRIEIQEQDSRWRRVCVDGKIICAPEGGWVVVSKNEEDVLDIVA